ncbi:TrbG/VirB9 family P-type conjugative transfer protein [Brevundimonas sp.]|uniref:TrbG/VirB9 family P-type conjugative transfer protein n=1 Tax=Brevundimonas sp. TaxID=1871086 RepID=UPI00257CE5E0|nr:TrbG/VirB9 family P-type conjugative transfer protein [Brevundimonas sp.]
MDPRRFLKTASLALALASALSGCAVLRPAPQPPLAEPAPSLPMDAAAAPVETSEPPSEPANVNDLAGSTARPYLETVRSRPPAPPASPAVGEAPSGRAAIAAANRSARAASSADAFVGGMQVFAWTEGRVYEVWTAPLRVTTLTLAPGETVTAKAAGDTVRWQIGESQSGAGPTARTHVLVKPLQAGLETNLILTTSHRVYLLALKSGDAEAFNAAVRWDYGLDLAALDAFAASGTPAVDVAAATPQGPLDARYRIDSRGRRPAWAPTAVFNDGVRTFITLSPDAAVDEAPALFILTGGESQLVNYRQADGVLIVDRVFQEAELRLGDRRPQIVRIRHLEGDRR